MLPWRGREKVHSALPDDFSSSFYPLALAFLETTPFDELCIVGSTDSKSPPLVMFGLSFREDFEDETFDFTGVFSDFSNLLAFRKSISSGNVLPFTEAGGSEYDVIGRISENWWIGFNDTERSIEEIYFDEGLKGLKAKHSNFEATIDAKIASLAGNDWHVIREAVIGELAKFDYFRQYPARNGHIPNHLDSKYREEWKNKIDAFGQQYLDKRVLPPCEAFIRSIQAILEAKL